MDLENIANNKDMKPVEVDKNAPFYGFTMPKQSATVGSKSQTVTFSFDGAIPNKVIEAMKGKTFIFDFDGNIYDKDCNLIQSGVAIEVLKNKE